jgi:hypothetical protein
MTNFRATLAALAVTMLTACASGTSADPSGVDVTNSTVSRRPGENPQIQLKLASGTYRCEQGQRVDVQRDPRNAQQIEVGWQGGRYGMVRNASYSGLPRYEHRSSGLVWIDLPWKGVLLDGSSGRPLANECKAS